MNVLRIFPLALWAILQSPSFAADPPTQIPKVAREKATKEKCFGVSRKENTDENFDYVPKGQCEKRGGSLIAPKPNAIETNGMAK